MNAADIMTRSLFIGGARDGTYMDVRERNEVRLVVPQSVWLPRSISDTREVFKYETYVRRKFLGDQKAFYVYALDSLTADDILRLLLDGYRKLK